MATSKVHLLCRHSRPCVPFHRSTQAIGVAEDSLVIDMVGAALLWVAAVHERMLLLLLVILCLSG
jgi:hypothetical protein